MPVIEKRASDLISKWIGESEQNIARAFAEARADGAMPIFENLPNNLKSRQFTASGSDWSLTGHGW